jgi:hypothetical protein
LIRLSKAPQSNRGEYDVGGSGFLSSTLFALKTLIGVHTEPAQGVLHAAASAAWTWVKEPIPDTLPRIRMRL